MAGRGEQLDICKHQWSEMDKKLDTIVETTKDIQKNITALNEDKIRQELINDEVLKKLQILNDRQENLALFEFLGRHWQWFLGAIATLGTLYLAYKQYLVTINPILK